MGSDNLHHKRKARNQIERRKASREPYERVLIVCEDSQATPSYLEAIRDDLKLNIANITICGEECGSAPISVVDYAIDLKNKDKGYDKVYCVIDRDQHQKFQKALQKAKGKKIEVIVSIPGFEYWLLLHFAYITSPFQAAQGSHCEEVIKALKKYWSDYKKGKNFLKQHYLGCLKAKQDIAIRNAKQRESECQHEKRLEDQNPYTQIHQLVEYLSNLKLA
jgi:hypothetical protein